MNKQDRYQALEKALWEYYDNHSRDLPWRRSITPYKVVVSEMMLQQTQVSRVEDYFREWMRLFPSWRALAQASRKDVLLQWQGLGYNRRALYLKRTAEIVSEQYNGRLPHEAQALEALPGIGPYTRGAIRAFAFNQLDAFLETNIRTVLIYHLNRSLSSVEISDKELLSWLETYLQYDKRAQNNPREFYYAMMDYGSYLKREVGNLNAKSKSYTKQSRFEGSRRQLRAGILRYILQNGPVSELKITEQSRRDTKEIKELLAELEKEGSISLQNKKYEI